MSCSAWAPAVVKRGRVVEQGTHDQLLAVGGVYHTLVQMQQMQGAESEDKEEQIAHLEAVPEVSGAAAGAAAVAAAAPACIVARLASWRAAGLQVKVPSNVETRLPKPLHMVPLLPCALLVCRTCLHRHARGPQRTAAPPWTGPAPRARSSQLPWAPSGRLVGTPPVQAC